MDTAASGGYRISNLGDLSAMTPYEQAARVYLKEPCRRTFREDLENHLFLGWVFNTPSLFMMGRRVQSTWKHKQIADSSLADTEGDCWHVWLAAGDMREAIRFIPFDLPLLSFERANRLVIMPMAKFKRMFSSHKL
jgi:hypothetical protein